MSPHHAAVLLSSAPAVAEADTSVAVCGKGATYNIGDGFRQDQSKSVEPFFIGALVKGWVDIAYGYGQAVGCKADGTMECYGQNVSQNTPFTVGPVGRYVGFFDYRRPLPLTDPGSEFNLPQQNAYLKGELGPVLTAEELIEKERNLDIPVRTSQDTRKACYGQVVFDPGLITTYSAGTWLCLKECVGRYPGAEGSEAYWVNVRDLDPPMASVEMLEKEFANGEKIPLTFGYNLPFPVPCPQALDVVQVTHRGVHGFGLRRDGTIFGYGHFVNQGASGVGYDPSYGPKKPDGPYDRAKRPSPTRKKPFRATITEGSAVLTHLEQVQENHNQASGSLGYGEARKAGSILHPYDELNETLPFATQKVKVVSADARELGIASGPFATTGAMAQGDTVIPMTGSKGKGFVNGALALFTTGAPKTVSEDDPNNGLLLNFAYYVVGEETDGYQLAEFEGGTPVKATDIIASGSQVVLVQMQTKAEAESKPAVKVTTPFSPGKNKILSITVDATATASYTGRLRMQRGVREQPRFPTGEGPAKAAGWPTEIKMPIDPLTGKAVAVKQIVTSASAGDPFTLALTVYGKVLAFGSSSHGQCGQGGTKFGSDIAVLEPKYVKNIAGTGDLEGIVAIGCGEQTSYGINTAGELLFWGSVDTGIGGKKLFTEEGIKQVSLPKVMAGLPTTLGQRPERVCGTRNTCLIQMENGDAWSVGGDERGELGRGTVSGTKSGGNPKPWSDTPAKITALAGVTRIAGGRYHFAVVAAGVAKTWGSNENGMLGNGESKAQKNGDGSKATDKVTVGGPVGTPTAVPVGGRVALEVACGEYNTAYILKGATPIHNPGAVTFKHEGEEGGDPAASLVLEWESPLTANWKVGWKLTGKWDEGALLEAEVVRLQQLLTELEEEGAEAEEIEEVEAELKAAELAEEEFTSAAKSGTKENITPEVVPGASPRRLRFVWKPPGKRITSPVSYTVSVVNSDNSWEGLNTETRSMWGCRYV